MIGAGRLRWPLRSPFAVVRSRWRRSLQLRVVTATMLLGLVVVFALGTLLLQRIQSGLVQERLVAARGEAARGLRDAQAQLDTANDSSGLNLLVNDMLPRLASPDPDDSRDVILLRGLGNDRPAVLPDLSSRDVDRAIIPLQMRERVMATGRQEEQFVRLRYNGSDRTLPGIAIGSRVTVPVAGAYELYFVFSLDREQETINLVRRSLVGGGAALVLLVGGIAYVVTRQVVRPVRQAAMVAQRLSSGRLQERMVPRGEDDLARLAASFNTMAHNLQTHISQLENLSRVQQRFVSDVSHELRTPLTTIRMAGDVLHESRADFAPAVARSAELLQTQLDRFEALLSDLLEISRIDAGGDLLDLEPVDLRDIVARVVDNAAPLAASVGSTLTATVVDGPVVAEVDARRIERILRNLVVNSLEHGNGKPVEVRIGADEHAVAIAVRDHGVGLRPGEAALVFNRFWRADPSRARTVGGTGLGPLDRDRGRAAAPGLAAGVGRAEPGLLLPAHAAAHRGGRAHLLAATARARGRRAGGGGRPALPTAGVQAAQLRHAALGREGLTCATQPSAGVTVRLAGVLVCAVLAGCGGALPDSGQAGAGRPIGDSSREPLQVVPEGPRPGAEPAEIVGGFLHAGAGFEDDHGVARSFLTGAAGPLWRPGQRTVVYPDDTSLTVTASGSGSRRRVTVSAPVWATIDADGQLVLGSAGDTARTGFGVTQVGREWRIDRLDDTFGLWMPRYEFERAYTPLRLAYVATGTRLLVPDLRWFAGVRASLATSLVRQLLRGPPAYLRGAVTSGAPVGTTLGVDAVPTSTGVAQVDLSATALQASPEQRQRLWAQLAATLRQLSTVSDISLTAAGAAYPVPGVPVSAPAADLGFSEDVRVAGPAMVLSRGRLLQVDPTSGELTTTRTGRFTGEVDVGGLRAVSAGGEADLLVGTDTSGTRLLMVSAASPRELLATGRDLAPPVIDRAGWAWTSDRSVPNAIAVSPATSTAQAAAPKAAAAPLRAFWLSGRRVQAVDVSRDGARLAVVSIGADGTRRLDVAGIVRDRTGRPTALAAPRQVGQGLADVRDVSWADRTNLAVLAGPVGQVLAYQVEVGGLVAPLPAVDGAAGIWAGDGLRAVYVATDEGQVLVRSGSGWRVLGPGSSVTIPQ